MMPEVTQKVARFCVKHSLLVKKDHLVIGVSGGPDSLCLLHLLVQFRSTFDLTLTIAHLNHQLRDVHSQADEAFVREIAERWQIPLRVETCEVAALAAQRKQSIEEAARQLRYAFLWRTALEVGAAKVAVGHNAGDQVETVLMHFLRGTGLAGLRGMLPLVDLAGLRLKAEDVPASSAPVKLIRPLLDISREEIEAYCQAHHLSPRQDASNQDTTFFRNRLRHELIPQLETYNPNIRQIIRRTAKVITADVEILEAELDRVWRNVVKNETPDWLEFDLAGWANLPLALKRATLRRAIQTLRRSLRDISFEHIESAIDLIEKRETSSQATLPQALMLTMGYQSFVIGPDTMEPEFQEATMPQLAQNESVMVQVPGVTTLPGGRWQLTTRFLPGQPLAPEILQQAEGWEAYLDADIVSDTLVLRTRQPGDIFFPLGLGGHRKKINEFMIDEKIPAGRRSHIPLLVANEQVVWVCGYRPAEQARIRPNTQRVLHLRFERQ